MGRPMTDTRGSYFGGLNNVLTATRIDDLPPVMDGFENVAVAADREMIAVLTTDLTGDES